MDQNAEQTLLAKKIQPTAMRMIVLNYLNNQFAALSLTDIERGLEPVDRITVYRTLKTFEENGIICSIEDGTGSTKYAVCSDNCTVQGHQDLHVHFLCQSCNETICLPKTNIPDINLPDGFLAIEHNLVVKGYCPSCSS